MGLHPSSGHWRNRGLGAVPVSTLAQIRAVYRLEVRGPSARIRAAVVREAEERLRVSDTRTAIVLDVEEFRQRRAREYREISQCLR